MLKIEMLPARHGDCLWIEYGDAKKPRRILIDAGPASTYQHLRERIQALPQGKRHFELFVVTHIDADHIEGAVRLLQDKPLGVSYGDIWFNGWKHLPLPSKGGTLGGPLGEYLTATILDRKLPWNEAFGGEAVMVPDEGELPVHEFSGMKLTLLSPTRERLAKLRPKWHKEVLEAGLLPGNKKKALAKLATTKRLHPVLGAPSLNVEKLAATVSKSDSAAANGSSIAVLAEYEGKRCILAGDAFPNVLAASLRRLQKRRGEKITLDVFKLPHHGSRSNVSSELIDLVRCKQYLFSSNGDIFEHPDQEAVARVIWHDKTTPLLCFNYRTGFNKMWETRSAVKKYKYQVKYPSLGKEGLLVEVK